MTIKKLNQNIRIAELLNNKELKFDLENQITAIRKERKLRKEAREYQAKKDQKVWGFLIDSLNE